jgi:hypothetical protein
MTDDDWNAGYARSLTVCLNGDAITEPGPRGERITDADFILMLNAHIQPVTFTIPPGIGSGAVSWQIVVNTGSPQALALVVNGMGGTVGIGVPAVVAADVMGGAAASLAGAGPLMSVNPAAAGPDGGSYPPAGSAPAGSIVTAEGAAGCAVEVASHAMVVLRAVRPRA